MVERRGGDAGAGGMNRQRRRAFGKGRDLRTGGDVPDRQGARRAASREPVDAADGEHVRLREEAESLNGASLERVGNEKLRLTGRRVPDPDAGADPAGAGERLAVRCE